MALYPKKKKSNEIYFKNQKYPENIKTTKAALEDLLSKHFALLPCFVLSSPGVGLAVSTAQNMFNKNKN